MDSDKEAGRSAAIEEAKQFLQSDRVKGLFHSTPNAIRPDSPDHPFAYPRGSDMDIVSRYSDGEVRYKLPSRGRQSPDADDDIWIGPLGGKHKNFKRSPIDYDDIPGHGHIDDQIHDGMNDYMAERQSRNPGRLPNDNASPLDDWGHLSMKVHPSHSDPRHQGPIHGASLPRSVSRHGFQPSQKQG